MSETRLSIGHASAGRGAPTRRICALLRRIGPYAAIELILPGGSLIALLVWLCRRNEVARSLIRACGTAVTAAIARPRRAGLVGKRATHWRWRRGAMQSPACA